ncbi:DinB family protein [Alicyclobacillus macrosporangiidus]|nr:DinB family protein [Alicyclobacillus macrosporangiidus]
MGEMTHPSVQLYEYHVWANDRTFEHLRQLPVEVFRKEVQSVFSSIAETIAHMYVVDNVWLLAMSGVSTEEIMASRKLLKEQIEDQDLESMSAMFDAVQERYRAFFEMQDMEDFSLYAHPSLGSMRVRYCDIVQHVVNHGTYHRGNITAMLRQQGFSGVPTDYVIYLLQLGPSRQNGGTEL